MATLLGRWTESDWDKLIIEKIYGNSYDQFISYLSRYVDTEDAFIVRKRDISYNITYEIADHFLAINIHINVVNLPIISEFLDITKKVISERDPIFDEPFDNHFYLSAFKKSTYSHSIKVGMTHTLILLALYADYQREISSFIRDLLTIINSIQDWAYISQFIVSLCEAAPDTVINYLENNIDNHTGLLDLFTAEKSNILGRHYYTNILWCLECLLPCEDYAVRVVKILFELGDKIDKCSTGNNPRDDISDVFCTWHNVSALKIEEKIELAKFGIEKYSFFWDILYNEIDKKTTIFSNSSFIYRETNEIVPYTNEDLLRFYASYNQLLISNIGTDLEKMVKLLNLLPECNDELFTAIQNKLITFVTNLSDPDKEQIKTSLRKIIYHQRYFSKAELAVSSDRILRIEKICLGISFDDPAYDFLYLTESSDIPILNPIAYDSEAEYYQKNEIARNKFVASEITKFKEAGIDLGHFLGLREIKSDNIGHIIAEYYCDSKYDQSILNIIINSTNNTQIAVAYVFCCSNSTLSEVYQAIEFLQKDHFADEFYVAFISALPFDEQSKSFVKGLPDEAAKNYWSKVTVRHKINSKDLLVEALKNLLKYINWFKLYFVMQEQESMLNTDEILKIISNATEKMILEDYKIRNNESYMIKQLLSIVYQRIGDDFESYPILFELEMRLFSVIGWNDMKCCQYLFKRNANLYADILSLTYKKDDGSFDETMDSEKKAYFYSLGEDIKFCPGEERGSINKDILNSWLDAFSKRLDTQNQGSLKYKKLGTLFANSPTGSDGYFPHEIIREKIEELGNEELIISFASAIIYG